MAHQNKNSAGKVARASAATANAVSTMGQVVSRNEETVGRATEATVGGLAALTKATGDVVARGGYAGGQALHLRAKGAGAVVSAAVGGEAPGPTRNAIAGTLSVLTRGTVHVLGGASQAIGVAGSAASLVGKGLSAISPLAGSVLGGALTGSVHVISDTVDAALLSPGEIERLRDQLRRAGDQLRARSEQIQLIIQQAQAADRRNVLLDSLAVGGVTLAQAARDPASVPPEVERAFELAYPGLAVSGRTFSDAAATMSTDQLVGLVSGVKGKLFELELFDHLNHGGLPEGLHAELANTATQPGWDIRVVDAQGHVDQLIQAKATESVAYVQEALQRYPAIHVTTTTEVHAQLTALGMSDVGDSGISEAALDHAVLAAAHSGDAFQASDLVPSSVALGAIALSVFLGAGDVREKGATVGRRAAKAGAAGIVGKSVLVATQVWWLGLIAGVASRWLLQKGRNKRHTYDALRAAVNSMGRIEHASLPQLNARLLGMKT